MRAEAKKKPTEMKPLLRQAESSKQTLHATKDTDRIADSGATSANNAANSGDDAVQVPGNPDDSNYDGDSNNSTSISIEQGRHAVPEKRGLSDSGDDVAKFPGNADGSHSDSDDDDASPIEQARHTASRKRRSGDSPSSFRQRKRSRRSRNEDDVSSSRPRSSSGHSLIIVDDGFAASVEQFPPLSLSLPLKEDALPEARSSEFSKPSHPDGASEVVLNRATRTQDWIVQAKSTARENPTAPEKSTARENPTTREKSTAPEKSIIVPEKSIIVPGKSIIVPALPAFSLEDAKCAIANLLFNEEVKSSTVDLVLPLVVTLD
ncbi:unnamed protein product [Zymoseptoria tritici ST99CH_3D1]|nr:unnamed protein product [Zymoseptoria tritici ST99CH_3D1]